MDFNIQDYLRDMREEQQRDHAELASKLDSVVENVGKHETRLVLVENTRRNLRWLTTALVTALLAVIGDLIVHTFSK